MIYRLLVALLAASVLGCSSSSVPSSCSSSSLSSASCEIMTTKVTLPSSPLTTINPRIQRAGDGFLLTRAALTDDEGPIRGASAIAAMGDGYAVHFRRVAGESGSIGFFDCSGHAAGVVPLPAEISVRGPIHSAPDVLLLSFRAGDGPWGWLEATCGAE